MKNPLNLPKSFLGANKSVGGRRVLVSQIELQHGIGSGVRLASFSNGVVPIYEEHLARLERGLDLKSWSDMPETEKALIVAVRRITIAIANLQGEAEIQDSERRSKR